MLDGGAELDLHRLLVWGPLGVRLPADDLWATARSFVVEGHELRTLGLEETLLHVACHLMVGGQPRGILVRDVAQLLSLRRTSTRSGPPDWPAGGEPKPSWPPAIRLAVAELGLVGELELVDWAAGYAPRLRDRAWLRIGQPGAALAGGRAGGHVVGAAAAPDGACWSAPRCTRRPETWPGPGRRVERVARRALRALSGTR